MNRTLAFLGAAALAISTAAHAQPSSIYGRDLTPGVYVRDSAIAVEKFAQAERLEHLREWGKAGDVYQEVISNFADRVVPSRTDPKTQNIVQYSSVLQAVQERLSRWPDEGLAAYRGRYEVEAQSLLDAAKSDDLGALHKVYATYFITDAAKNAGAKLVDAYLEAGEFSAAAWIADHLLTLHPSVRPGAASAANERPRLLFRAGLAYHFAGYESRATDKRDELWRDFADALGKVRGQDVRLADALDAELKLPRPVAMTASAASDDSAVSNDSWPMFFGSADRARISPAVTTVGTKLFSIDLGRFEANLPRPLRALIEPENDAARAAGTMTGVFPAVDRGELYFQDNASLYAVSLETGLPLPGWAQTYDGDRAGRYHAPGLVIPTPRGHSCTVSLTDDSVFAILGQNDAVAMAQLNKATIQNTTRLVCLDRRNGAERWNVRPRMLVNTDEPNTASLRDLAFSGSPLIVGDRVFVIGRGGKAIGFEDCYVICLDADTGRLRWSCSIASANTGNQIFDADPLESGVSQSASHLAYAAGRVYCATNLGAVAALDAYDGSIAWLNLYDRAAADFSANAMLRRNGLVQNVSPVDKPWTYNPVIVTDGKVFVLPSDGIEGYIYDAASGEILVRVPLKIRVRNFDKTQPYEPNDVEEPMRALLAVMNDRLILAGNRSIIAIDWKAIDPKKPINEARRWSKTINLAAAESRRLPSKQAPTILGRPFVSSQNVFIPTIDHFELCDLSGRMPTKGLYPPSGTWPTDEGPGNVLATREHVIVAGPTRITVYADPIAGAQRLDAAVAAAPSDPEPRLRYAELMFISRRYDQVLPKLDEAIKLMGGNGSSNVAGNGNSAGNNAGNNAGNSAIAVGANRDRLFGDSILFAQKLMRDARGGNGGRMPDDVPAGAADIVKSLFDRAADAASSPAQQVSYRLARADHAHLLNDEATELRLYQEILSEPQWRNVLVSRGANNIAAPAALPGTVASLKADANADATGPRQSAAIATAAIGEMIRRPSGKAIYEPIERRAATALAAARTANDPEALLAIAQTYPNAAASREAMSLAADGYEMAGNARAAVQTLRQLYVRSATADAIERARILEAMARNYLTMPNRFDVAAARLAAAARIAPDAKLARPIRIHAQSENAAPADPAAIEHDELLKDITFAQAIDAVRNVQSHATDRSLPDLGLGGAGKIAMLGKQDTTATIANVKALLVPKNDVARFDRIVTAADPAKGAAALSVYAVGSSTPLFSTNIFSDADVRGVAWVGGNLIAWSDDKLAMFGGESGQAVWQISPATLPRMETLGDDALAATGNGNGADRNNAPANADDATAPVNGAVNAAADGADDVADIQIGNGKMHVRRLRGGQQDLIFDGGGGLPAQQVRMQRGMRVRAVVVGNRRFVMQGGIAMPVGQQVANVNEKKEDPAAANKSADSIVAVAPLSDRVIVATADGRIAAIDLLDGRTLWQARPARSSIDKLLANDDFVVVRMDDPTSGGSKLVALDASSGAIVYRRSFSPDPSNGTLPVNIALADDGTLVWLLPDRVAGKDLFEPGDGLRFGQVPIDVDVNNNAPPFAGITGDDQLLILGTRIFAVVDGGSGVRVLSLENGAITKSDNGKALRLATGIAPMAVANGQREATDVSLRAVGSMLYVIAPNVVTPYELESLYQPWTMITGENGEMAGATIRDVLIGRSALVVVAEGRPLSRRRANAPAPATALRVLVHSREMMTPKPGQQPGKPREGGGLTFTASEPEPTGIRQSQAVNGGLYYLSGDGVLHFIPGAATTKK